MKIAESTIQYNRSKKQWETHLDGGQVIAHPAGKEGKRLAQLAALHHDAPRIASHAESLIETVKARGCPQAIDRIIRAARLVEAGAVRERRAIDRPGSYVPEIARVESQSEPGLFYGITYANPNDSFGREEGFACECADSSNGVKLRVLPPGNPDRPPFGAPFLPSFGYACKHALATYIAIQLDFEYSWQPEPIPFEGEPLMSYEDLPLSDEEQAEMDELGLIRF